MASLIVLLTLAGGVAGQLSPYSRLLITARGSKAGQSLLYGVDSRTGAVQTLFNQMQGTLVDIAMDHDNIGYTAVYEGLNETGIHFLRPDGQATTLVQTLRQTHTEASFRCVDIGVEEVWLIGTGEAHGYGRIRSLVPGSQVFTDVVNFEGLDVTEVVIEQKTGSFIFALNGPGGGVLCSFAQNPSESVILASGLSSIVDLVSDPHTDGLLVATQDNFYPLLFIDPAATSNAIKSFSLPPAVLPIGNLVDAVALDPRADTNGDCALWILSSDRLCRIYWNVYSQSIRIPAVIPVYPLPSRSPTSMIFEGDREFLLSTQLSSLRILPRDATLRIRMGPQYKNLAYAIAASFSMTPGIPISKSRLINLTPDPLLFLSLSGSAPAVFSGFSGVVGPKGEVTGKVKGRADWSRALQGIPIYFAGVILDPAAPGGVRTVTNTVGLVLF
jgi:hypothetical protein